MSQIKRIAGLGQIEALIRNGRPSAALQLIRSSQRSSSQDARLHHLSGIALLMLGKCEEAVDSLKEAVRLNPEHGLYQLHLGEAARAAGQYHLAVQAYYQAEAAGRGGYDLAIRLGDTFEALNDLSQALFHFRRAFDEQPADAALAIRIANLLNKLGQKDDAIGMLEAVVVANPEAAGAFNNLGVLLAELGRNEDAINALNRACALRPQEAEYACNLARILLDAGDVASAAVVLEGAIAAAPGAVRPNALLATVEERRNDVARAQEFAQTAQALEPDNPEVALVLARLARRKGELQQALTYLEPFVDLTALPLALATAIATERGLSLDRLGKVPEAIASFHLSNQLHMGGRQVSGIDQDAFIREVTEQRQLFLGKGDEAIPIPDDGFADPVFIVGFPRSGTTLVEQALARHPLLLTSDEVPVLDRVIRQAPDRAYLKEAHSLRQLRRTYFDEMERALGSLDGRILVDKLPLNIVHLGSVAKLFPRARIVVALRDPRDVVLSCWMQNFRLNEAMVQFLDLGRAAFSYSEVMSCPPSAPMAQI